MRRAVRVTVALSLFAAVIGVAARSAQAQKYTNLGRSKCVNCHDHRREKLWSEQKDGPPPNNHLNAHRRLDSPRSARFAKAVGVADPHDPGSVCATCHATVVKGDVAGGVTCETCHGPASDYVDMHQNTGAYQAAVVAGMADVVKKPQAWAALCMNCHVMNDPRLIAATHPSGDNFDLGAKVQVVATDHFKNTYDKRQISALGKAELVKIQARRKGGPAVTTAPGTPAAAAVAPAAPAAARTVPAVPAGLPPTLPPPPPPPPADASSDVINAVSALSTVLPASPAAAVAAVQGRAIALIDALLRRGGRAPVRITPPERKTEYRGPDADLLRLQDDVLSLAIEALRTAPRPPESTPKH